MDVQSIIQTLVKMGIPLATLADFAIFAPVILFFVTIALYFISSAQSSRRKMQEKIARGILAGARRRSSSLTAEEIAARIRPKEEEEEGAKRFLMQISEILLKLVNFNKELTKERLVQAGQRDPKAISRYIIMRGSGMMITPMVAWFIGPYLGLFGVLKLGVALAGILVGGIVVDVQLDKAVAARRARVNNELPVLLDLLTIYLEAGSAFDVALARSSVELRVSFPTAAAEIFFLRRDLELSVDRERTLREFATRINSQVAKTFVAIVIQAERRGNAIAPALRTLAKEARKEVMAEIEKKAQKIPTMMQLPMFVFILPAIFAAVIGPAAVAIVHKFAEMHH